MTEKAFSPTMSTNEIWRGDEVSRCLTDDLDAMDAIHTFLPSNYAAKNHTHNNYLPLSGGTLTGNVTTSKDINMGVEAAINGKAADGTLKNVFTAMSAGGNTAIGYDNYQKSNGTTNLYGNSVRIWSRTGGLAGANYGENKVLWNGASYVKEDTTITLSGNVSAQPHGISLIFSAYDVGNTAPVNSSWNSFFIPKYAVANDSGGGFSFILERGGKFYKKYLYINNNEIRGNAVNNNSAFSLHGQTVDNRNMVLRYVIGV
nr:MAG TPA: hypothetical protein [Caudoviricetes sp.]